jgi:polyhydroxyalkanoate synthesis regulator phasin
MNQNEAARLYKELEDQIKQEYESMQQRIHQRLEEIAAEAEKKLKSL